MLNLFNPMKPEGSYELDLSRREERLIVKILAQLSIVEPGDNLPYLAFQWERDMDYMPGKCLLAPIHLLSLAGSLWLWILRLGRARSAALSYTWAGFVFRVLCCVVVWQATSSRSCG